MVGNYVLSESAREAYLGSAVAVRAALVDEVQQVWTSGVDAVIGPTCPSGPWALDSEAASDVVGMYANDVMTIAANLTGTSGLGGQLHVFAAWACMGCSRSAVPFRRRAGCERAGGARACRERPFHSRASIVASAGSPRRRGYYNAGGTGSRKTRRF